MIQLHALANHLWQSTLFTAAAGLLVLALRRSRAQTRYWVWLAASGKFLIPFSLLIDLGSHLERHRALAITPALSSVIVQASQPFTVPPPPVAISIANETASPNWVVTVLFAVWMLGSATLVFSWWQRWRVLRASVRTASPLDLPIGMRAMVSHTFSEPGVFGVFRPVLLLPAGITDRLTPPQLKAIVAHELCHVHRRDNLATAIHMGVEALFWFHPLVWWLGARLMEERERACDEAVLLTGSEPEAYAEAILKICELYLESPLPCVSGVTGADLRKRIEEIMSNRIGKRLNGATKMALALAATLTLVTPIVIGMLTDPAIAQAQQDRPISQKPLTFEAASVKPNQAGGPFSRSMGGPGTTDPGRIRYSNMSLKSLLLIAYDVSDFQIEGPGWMETGRFDVDATMPADTTKEQFREMLRNLLLERFRITLHRQTKEVPAYTLVAGRNGTRMAASVPATIPPDGAASGPVPPQQFERDQEGFPRLPPGGPPNLLQFVVLNRARLEGRFQTMGDLANRLAYLLGRPVSDGTGLTGKYDFRLTFATEGTVLAKAITPPLASPPAGVAPNADAETVPDLFSAVQSQLGLKLEAKRANMEVIAIDRADRTPLAN